MPGVILHGYPLSPFFEKVRLALGLKGVAYQSVTVPVWMPKPDLLPLTGGYRRAPVMQVGSDIYCDTLLILQAIERPPGRRNRTRRASRATPTTLPAASPATA